MPLINWGSKYQTGISEIDKQHKELFRIINELYDSMKEGKAKEKISDTLSFLASYTIEHFQAEEKLMRAYAFSGFSAHKIEHDKLVKQVQDFIKKQDKTVNLSMTLEISKFLSAWITEHILGQDAGYVEFFKSKGLK